jgi:hypothetical protein
MKKNETKILGEKNTESLSERVKKNEAFFSSFLDLVPARIYMNTDDRHNWIELATNQSKKRKPSDETEPAQEPKNAKTKKQKQDEDENGDDADENEVDERKAQSENGFYKPNRFDPRFFKTVSQILRDLESYHQNTKSSFDLKSNLKRAKLNSTLNGAHKSTAIKVLNKSQNKSLSKSASDSNANDKEEENDAPANGSPANSSAKKAVKRASKFKEEKRAEIKRQRQRYDSQSEPQIVEIDHSEANSTENRKQILNKNGQIVYSKFDFTADKTLHSKKNKDSKLTPANAKPKDYKKLLKKLQEEKEKKEQLKQSEPEKASELELKTKWKTAIDKAAGVKIKDDVQLLKKSVKKLEKKKEKSKKGWEERNKQVEMKKNQAQEKRRKNLDKRKEKKKENKIKKLKKKGRILPGF